MKKTLLIGLILLGSVALLGCKRFGGNNSNEELGQDNEHDIMPYVEAACQYSNGQVSENEDGKGICIFSDDSFCFLNEILEGKCESHLLWDETQGRIDLWNAQFYCEDNGGEVNIFDELCIFDDMSGCDLVDYYYGRCNKGDEQYQKIDDLTWARNKCIEKNGQLSEDEEGNEVCIFENGETIPTSETFLFGFEF